MELIGGLFAMVAWLIAGIISLVGLIFWIVCLIDCVKRDFSDSTMKIVWILVLVFTGWIGGLIYWFVGRPMGRLR